MKPRELAKVLGGLLERPHVLSVTQAMALRQAADLLAAARLETDRDQVRHRPHPQLVYQRFVIETAWEPAEANAACSDAAD